ncbi:non-ribosomal peptide synthetase [Pedobacter aquatilis]|uniref:non-ribosomal peptide synthetase n=1 Tax=Pedobacter aquatilis TaxID=351343 RepID=UPI0029319AFC|nr:condensation domain-containing protein [Pedobacter aquatilis]
MADIKLIATTYNPFQEHKKIEKIVVINEPQRLIWLSCIIGGASASLAYNESVSLSLTGEFDFLSLKEAFDEVISRHEALRATVTTSGEHLIIYDEWHLDIPLIDISNVTDKQASIKSFISSEMNEAFDLQNGPLFRAFVHKLSNDHHHLTIVGHHMVCDGWSFGIILENLSHLYNSKITGSKSLLKKANQISEYALTMHDFKSSALHEEVKNYWLSVYQDGIPMVDFPTDYPRPINRTYQSHRFDHPVSLNLVEQLKKLGAKNGASLVNTLLSAFEIFIALKTGQVDIIVGIPTAGQAAAEMFELVGHCVNLLALRAKVDSSLTFSQYLAERKAAFFDAYENQKFTFGELVETLDHQRVQSRIPILPIIFNIDMGMDTLVSFEKLQHQLISNPRVYETFEIFLNATGSESSFVLEWSYNTQLFKLDTIKKLSAQFEQLLETLVTLPDSKVKQLIDKHDTLCKEQQSESNNTLVPYDKETKLSELIDLTALNYPDQTAVVLEDQNLTYKQLKSYSDSLAAYFVTKGICPGDVIALALNYSPELVACALGAMKCGAKVLLIDLACPDFAIENMLADSNTKLILINKSLAYRKITSTDKLFLEDIWLEVNKKELKKPATISLDETAFIYYTFSSSEKLSAIHLKHSSLVNLLTSLKSAPGISSSDKFLVSAGTQLDTKIVELFLPLTCGGEIIMDGFYIGSAGSSLLDFVSRNNITIISAIPSTLKLLTSSLSNPATKLSATIWNFGNGLTKELADHLLSNFNSLWNFYGLPETGIISAIKEINLSDEGINIGKPINNTRIYIADESGNILLNNKVGEVLIAGAGVSAPSIIENDFALRNEASTVNSSEITPGYFYPTGDLGRFSDNGDLQYLGRSDNQITIDGQRIDLNIVEEEIKLQDNVDSAILLAKENRAGRMNLTAYVVPISKENLNESLFIDSLKGILEKQFPMLMQPNNFIIIEKFPLKPNHEIDINALPKVKSASNNLFLDEVHTEMERIILSIWSSILGIGDIDKDDDFFEIGGNSMLAVKMIAEIERKLGKRFALATLITNSTIRKLARRIESSDEQEQWESLVPIKTAGTKTPLFLVHGAGLNILLFRSISKFFDEDQPMYGIQAFGLNDEKEIPQTIEEIARKHIEEIVQVHPTGPYAVAGYSLGGYIAFEIVRQLLALGKEVSFLGVIDTYAINRKSSESNIKLVKKIQRQFYKVPFFAKSFLNNPKEAASYQLYILQNKIRSKLAPETVVKQMVTTNRESEIYKVYAEAYENYDLQPLPIKLTLFRVEKRLYYLDDLTYLGWDKLTTKGIEVNVVPGDHKTFLEPPNDQRFAQTIQLALNKLNVGELEHD